MTTTLQRLLSVLITAVVLLAAQDGSAHEAPCAVVEISTPPPGFGTAALRTAAESEARKVDASLLRDRRRVVISLALTESGQSRVICSINATVRDARTGTMLAIIETDARADGPVSQKTRNEMADAAVRSAVRRVPHALRGK